MTDNSDQSRARTARVTQAERLAPEVARLDAEGLTRNAMAVRLGCSVGTVTNAARIAGVTFDRSATYQAVEAARIDAKADRAAIDEKLRANVNLGLEKLSTALRSIEIVTAADARAVAAIVTSTLGAHLRIAQFDSVGSIDQSDISQYLNLMLGRTELPTSG